MVVLFFSTRESNQRDASVGHPPTVTRTLSECDMLARLRSTITGLLRNIRLVTI